MDPSEMERTVMVKGLDSKTTEDTLYELFLQAGPIKYVKLPLDRETNKHRGISYICYEHICTVPYAVHLLDGISLHDQNISVQTRTRGNYGTIHDVGVHSLDPEFINEKGFRRHQAPDFPVLDTQTNSSERHTSDAYAAYNQSNQTMHHQGYNNYGSSQTKAVSGFGGAYASPFYNMPIIPPSLMGVPPGSYSYGHSNSNSGHSRHYDRPRNHDRSSHHSNMRDHLHYPSSNDSKSLGLSRSSSYPERDNKSRHHSHDNEQFKHQRTKSYDSNRHKKW